MENDCRVLITPLMIKTVRSLTEGHKEISYSEMHRRVEEAYRKQEMNGFGGMDNLSAMYIAWEIYCRWQIFCSGGPAVPEVIEDKSDCASGHYYLCQDTEL